MRIALRAMLYVLAMALLVLAVTVAWLWPIYDYRPAESSPFSLQRLPGNPQLYAVAPELGYANIAGPSVIRVPDWVENPLGQYYLYFAHHKGSYIRMAYADSPAGPWTLHDEGALRLEDSGFATALVEKPTLTAIIGDLFATFSLAVTRDYLLLAHRAMVTDPAIRESRGLAAAANQAPHIASPEVVIDEDKRELLMFFHGYDQRGGQSSAVAVSADGLEFALDIAQPRLLTTYLRMFQHDGYYYLLGMPGVLYRGESPRGPFQPRDSILFEPDMRHAGVWVSGDTLYVFWSRVGYAPERLLLSKVELGDPDWDNWRATAPVDVLSPEMVWEGSLLPVQASLRGELDVPARELRDPYVLQDRDGQLYLYYVGGGEQAIGVARMLIDTNEAALVPR